MLSVSLWTCVHPATFLHSTCPQRAHVLRFAIVLQMHLTVWTRALLLDNILNITTVPIPKSLAGDDRKGNAAHGAAHRTVVPISDPTLHALPGHCCCNTGTAVIYRGIREAS